MLYISILNILSLAMSENSVFYLVLVANLVTPKRQVSHDAAHIMPGELHLSGNHTETEYEMSGEPYSQKSRWIVQSNKQYFQVMTFK